MHVNLSSISPISNRATQQQSNNKSDKKQETGPAVTGCKKRRSNCQNKTKWSANGVNNNKQPHSPPQHAISTLLCNKAKEK
jgi:hypothetical protein